MSRQENLERIMSMGFRHKMGRELDPNFSKLSNSLGYIIPTPLLGENIDRCTIQIAIWVCTVCPDLSVQKLRIIGYRNDPKFSDRLL